MADRLPSDHDAVETHRATVSQVGRMGRPQVAVPDSVAVDEGEVFRVVLDGEEYHGRVETTLDGDRVIRRAADNARLVREGEGENRLAEWFDDVDVALATRSTSTSSPRATSTASGRPATAPSTPRRTGPTRRWRTSRAASRSNGPLSP